MGVTNGGRAPTPLENTMARLDELTPAAYSALLAREAARIVEAGGTWEGYRKARRIGDTVALSRADRRAIFADWADKAAIGTPADMARVRLLLEDCRAARAAYLRNNPRIARSI